MAYLFWLSEHQLERIQLSAVLLGATLIFWL